MRRYSSRKPGGAAASETLRKLLVKKRAGRSSVKSEPSAWACTRGGGAEDLREGRAH